MPDPTSRRQVRPIRSVIPGRPVDFQRGGLDPDIEALYDILESLEADAAQIGTVDVPAGGYSEGDLLVFIGGTWMAVNKTALLSLDDLTDVVVAGENTDDVLQFDGANWVNGPLELDQLSDVTIFSPTLGEVLTFNGSEWINDNWVDGAFGVGVAPGVNNQFQVEQLQLTSYLSAFGSTTIGSPGWRLDKNDKTNGSPHVITWMVEGVAQWEAGMDFDTNNVDGHSDFIPVYDRTANAGLGADIFRFSHEADSADVPTVKCVLARVAGTPNAQTEFFLIDGGDNTTPFSSTTFKGYFDGTTNACSIINRNAGNKAARWNWNNLWVTGADVTGANLSNLTLAFDSVNNKNRLFVKASSDLTSRVGFGSTDPQAIVSIKTDADSSLYDVVQRGLHMQYANAPANRAINLEQILSASEVHNYLWLEGGLGASSTAAARVSTSTFDRAWGLRAGTDNKFELVTAPSGSNQTITPWLTVDSNVDGTWSDGFDFIFGTGTGTKIGTSTSQKLGFYNATPIVRPSGYTQLYSTADKSLAAYTADDESAAYTGIDNTQVGTVYAQVADLNALRAAYENLRAFVEDAVQMLNAVVDDAQSLGLVG